MAYEYVIVGCGIAGVTAAKEIRKNDDTGTILLLGDENRDGYYRIKLTELLGEKDPTFPDLNKEGWAKQLGIDEFIGEKVEKIDFESKTLTLKSGKTVRGNKILLANGSHASAPPFENKDIPGVFTLRSYDDLLGIQKYLKGKQRVGVIGGGLLGLEAARSLKELGKEVAIIHHSDYVLSRQLDRELGLMLNEELKDQGYMVYTDKNTSRFLGDDHLEGIEFEDGSVLDLDFVLLSTGVKPNIQLFEGTGLAIDRGVVVDHSLKTNIDGVYAAGDVAQVDGKVMGIWPASMSMGRVAGANMAGGALRYDNPMLFTRLDMGDIQIFSAGEVGEGDVYFYDDGDIHHRLYAKDGMITGVILYGETKNMMKFKKMVEEKAPVDEAISAAYPFTEKKA
ncbi:Benzene 1,2-dioxygenase system ferredoxin--NAD(+) reductase subunit [Aedoeadaptatus ivorii]|uniref:Benzene 1,2-dioxygenase system ferredoxin--NAD(+) reductase subunit n=1 Tax=Aedoeadaptatus ivorii TaxID=54006 RepID=A0A3S5C293_9FIRM|nr:FAD-dependent oxidoreductase [Peptoniphilus ivorii]VEJ35111.1 Benzene 1,2-dioxygenase system ferredoxin--NAD(+) reductase subunit [Peptoniphilus ivorii]